LKGRNSGQAIDTMNFRSIFRTAFIQVGLGKKTDPNLWECERFLPHDLGNWQCAS
jgi:hypothetical protein